MVLFFHGQFQSILEEEERFSPRPLQCVMFLGEDLSLFLFNVYIKLLGKVMNTQLYISTPSQADEAVAVLMKCLEAIKVWMGRANFNSTLARRSDFGLGEQISKVTPFCCG